MSVLLADIDATCAALGYSDGQRYQAEPDAMQGLKHLIWILRRDLDNHEYRRHLGHAKVLQTDLVYMLPEYINDDEFSDVLIRLLVILTNPTLLLYRDGPPKDNHGRKVFMELIDILQGYKNAFTRDKIWAALFGKLKTSLEIDWALRSEEQSLLIERILVLMRNVLQVPANPEAECRADNDASVHDQVIWALHQSGILDLVLFIISSPDEHQFHLHCLEILCLLYREQTAESLADASMQRSVSEKQRDEQELLAARRREKQRTSAKPPPGRHSRFGGTYVIRNLKSVSDRDIICHQPLERVTSIDFDREKQQQKRSFRHIREEAQVKRRSAFSVRLCLREYCIEVLRSAYNTLVRQVRRVLERNSSSTSHDDSYLLWAIRFFMEFNRLSDMKLELVSESLSVQCFHWVLTRMQHHMDMIVSDKKQARPWAKRLHVALQTFRELLQSMLALQKLKDDNAGALFDMLLNNVCYVLEYRETILHLLMNYNETHSTKAYLRDVVETANIYIKMMEKFCKDSVVVQDKKRTVKRSSKKTKKPEKSKQETEEELSNKWAEMADEMSQLLATELQIPEDEQPIPFDSASDVPIDDQKEDCMIRIHKMLRTGKLDHAIALMRAAREVWPDNDVFGAMSAAPEDELLLMREIFMHNITTVDPTDEDDENSEPSDDEENEEVEDDRVVEKTFKFDDFAKRLVNPKIVRACVVVLADWEQIPTKSLKAAVTILHRIAYGCSCPAMLYQAKLFRIFQEVMNAGRDAHHEELRRLAVFVVRKFVETAPNNPKIYAELLFYKTIKEANELESGYCDAYESGTKGTWTEEQEAELRFLFEENQRNPETDKDVIDWILDNILDKTRTRRGILKKLKEMDLKFKAPTKKSTANAQSGKNLWRSEEDEELRSLYDQYRIEDDCLQRILDEFEGRRTKQQIIKRMLQIHIIADKSEILPQKLPKRQKSKKTASEENAEEEFMEEPILGGGSGPAKAKPARKPSKAQKRNVVRTPLDVGTVRALLAQINADKYQESIDWLKECIDDAAEDVDEPGDEDDGVPLVPLQEQQKEAMEDEHFKKVLVALGIQPPVLGMETYWRIPTYLNSADLKLRAKIVGGEEIEIDVDGIDDDDDEDNNGSEENDSDIEGSNTQNGEESEEDYLETLGMAKERRKLDNLENFRDHQREKLKNLMFSKSDEETEERVPLQGKKKPKTKKAPKEKEKLPESEDEDPELVNEIQKKLNKKKRNYDLSSDEKPSDTDDTFKISEEKEVMKPNTEDLFDQLKAKRASSKIKLSDMVIDKKGTDKTKPAEDEDDDTDLNFNSEDYRKRLLELGDEDDDEDGGTYDAKDKEKEKTLTNRSRRANVIESDDDDDDDTIKSIKGQSDDKDAATGKRRRSFADDYEPSGHDSANENDDDVQFLARKKPSPAELAAAETDEKPAKRRRLAIIEDDEDDY
ncbi:protein timeless homolog [Stomoxys calcitrans]|uniref:protein timeless homolog n=1 Tax=Stomoxys calcitrans TaxID=35570 RepID=UPI0027E2ECE7|nr:protein timeless homolog [Stomoxys calcitrans]